MHRQLQQQRRALQPRHHAKRARTALVAAASPSFSSSPPPPVRAADSSVVWTQTSNGSWVASPPYSPSVVRRPPGVVHLLGGAFAGAAPQVAYARLAEALVAPPRRGGGSGGGGGGFTVVATPYRLTFDHLRSAQRVRRDLRDAVEEVAAGGGGGSSMAAAQRACSAVLEGSAPLFAVGHSNGALLHALGACQREEEEDAEEQEEPLLLRPRAAVLVSYNNKAVGDAVPFGLLDRLRDALPPPAGAEEEGREGAAPPLPPSLTPLAEALVPARIARASPALEQVATVADEVRRGASDFDPPPERTREIVARLYPRALRTLLVRFSDDGTDETPELARMLPDRPHVASVVLPGNHLTPCGVDEGLLRPPVVAAAAAAMTRPSASPAVRPFTPADALAMAAREWGRAAREHDADRLADRVVAFLRAAAAAE